MKEINKNRKNDDKIRIIILLIAAFSFLFSTNFGWGFIIGGLVSKQNINLKSRASLKLLFLTTLILILIIYILIGLKAVLGFSLSTVLYFIIRKLLYNY